MIPQRDEAVLILWSDSLDDIIPLCRDFEDKLIKLVWRQRATVSAAPSDIIPSTVPSHDNLPATKEELTEEIPITEKELTNRKPQPKPSSPIWKIFSWSTTRQEHQGDAEKGAKKIRRTKLIAPFYNGLGCGLSLCNYRLQLLPNLDLPLLIVFIGTGISMLLQESMLDGQWIRFCLLVTAPLSFCVSLVRRGNQCCFLNEIDM